MRRFSPVAGDGYDDDDDYYGDADHDDGDAAVNDDDDDDDDDDASVDDADTTVEDGGGDYPYDDDDRDADAGEGVPDAFLVIGPVPPALALAAAAAEDESDLHRDATLSLVAGLRQGVYPADPGGSGGGRRPLNLERRRALEGWLLLLRTSLPPGMRAARGLADDLLGSLEEVAQDRRALYLLLDRWNLYSGGTWSDGCRRGGAARPGGPELGRPTAATSAARGSCCT